MSISVLRTADAWYVQTPTGAAARIDTRATTTGQLLAEPEAIVTAAASTGTVPVDGLALVSPVTAPCRVVAQMTNYASHVTDSGMNPDTIPLTFFRKSSGSISGPTDDIIRPAHVRLLDYEVEIGLVIGRELPVGTTVTEDNLAEYVVGLVVTDDVSARDVQLPQTQFYEAKSYPTFTPVGPALVLLTADELKRFPDLRLRLSVNGRGAPGRLRRHRHDLLAAAGPAGADPFPAPRPRRPRAHRHPGRHRPVRAAQAGRDARLAATAPAQVEALLRPPGRQPRATSRTATSSRPAWPPTTARSTSAPSARPSGGRDERVTARRRRTGRGRVRRARRREDPRPAPDAGPGRPPRVLRHGLPGDRRPGDRRRSRGRCSASRLPLIGGARRRRAAAPARRRPRRPPPQRRLPAPPGTRAWWPDCWSPPTSSSCLERPP